MSALDHHMVFSEIPHQPIWTFLILPLSRMVYVLRLGTFRISGVPQSKNPRRSQRMVEEAVDMFVRMENWDGLAVIFSRLPSGMSIIRCCLRRDFLPIFSATVNGHLNRAFLVKIFPGWAVNTQRGRQMQGDTYLRASVQQCHTFGQECRGSCGSIYVVTARERKPHEKVD